MKYDNFISKWLVVRAVREPENNGNVSRNSRLSGFEL